MIRELALYIDNKLECIVTIGMDGILNTTTKDDAYYGKYKIEFCNANHILHYKGDTCLLGPRPDAECLLHTRFFTEVTNRLVYFTECGSIRRKRLSDYLSSYGLLLEDYPDIRKFDDAEAIAMKKGRRKK